MTDLKKLAIASIFAASAVAAFAPASATVTTFAQYNQVASTSTRTLSWRQIGTGGRLCTIGTASGSCPASTATAVTASVDVNFSFLQSGLGASGPISAKLIIDLIAAPGSAASSSSAGGINYLVQPGLSGTFSIVADTAFTYNGITSTDLLHGSITNATISGQVGSSSGSVNGSTLTLHDGTAVQFGSGFLDFSNTVNRDFALTLTAINPSIAVSSSGPARTFRAASTGSFSSDPAPLINGSVPEPASWALMLAGFGAVGTAMRRRKVAVTFA
jgi:hypothetical protein